MLVAFVGFVRYYQSLSFHDGLLERIHVDGDHVDGITFTSIGDVLPIPFMKGRIHVDGDRERSGGINEGETCTLPRGGLLMLLWGSDLEMTQAAAESGSECIGSGSLGGCCVFDTVGGGIGGVAGRWTWMV